MVTKSKVDPDTGLTPKEQANFFKNKPTAEQLGYYDKTDPADKKPKAKPARKLARASDSSVADAVVNDLKVQAVNLYGQGLGPKEVAKLLSITYANAYYYKRFVKSEKADTRLKESLKRV